MRRSIVEEYAEAMRGRYRGSSRTKKGRLLDEFTEVTGYNGKSAHVGQKNWTVVRRLVGYDRYSTRAALAQLEKVHKAYDKAKTSYQRLLEWDVLTTEERQAFGRTYRAINPVVSGRGSMPPFRPCGTPQAVARTTTLR